jgi:hypothetical protein
MSPGRVEIVQDPDTACYSWRLVRIDGLILDCGGPYRRLEQAADSARAVYGPSIPITFRARQGVSA